MHPTRLSLCLIAVTITVLSLASPAAGQSSLGSTRIAGLVSGSIGNGRSAATIGVSASYRFAPRLAVEGDFSYFSDLTLVEFSNPCPTAGACIQSTQSWHARVASGTVNVVTELPSGVSWLRPYIAAGGGAARVRRDVRGAISCQICGPRQPRYDTRPVLSLGGGVDFPMGHGLALGFDVRYQRVYEDATLFRPNLRDLTRVGSLVSYRF